MVVSERLINSHEDRQSDTYTLGEGAAAAAATSDTRVA